MKNILLLLAFSFMHFADIRELAKGVPVGTRMEFTLNNGDVIYGRLLRYEGATDYIWYLKDGVSDTWFNRTFTDGVFSVHELRELKLAGEV